MPSGMPGGKPENLIPMNQRTEEEQKKIASMGGKASQEVQREKKKISQIYADFLVKKYKLTTGEEMTGAEMADRLISNEIREATEGNKVDITVNHDLLNAIKELK
jgi:hypothetical protein